VECKDAPKKPIELVNDRRLGSNIASAWRSKLLGTSGAAEASLWRGGWLIFRAREVELGGDTMGTARLDILETVEKRER
jgi:hypothetical protein